MNSNPSAGACCVAMGILLVALLPIACASTAHPDSYADSGRDIDSLRARPVELGTQLQSLGTEQTRATDEIRLHLIEAAAPQQAEDERILTLLGQRQSATVSRSPKADPKFLDLINQITALRHTQDEMRDRIERLQSGSDRLQLKIETLDARLNEQVTATLKSIAAAVSTKESDIKKSIPSLIGTLVGAMIALLSSIGVAWWNQDHSSKQKRRELTNQVIDRYLSETIQEIYARALGFLQPAAWQHLKAPENRNVVIRMHGFFEYVAALASQKQLDADLAKASGILTYAGEFRNLMKTVDITRVPEFASIKQQID